MSINERLKFLIKELGISARAFSLKLGVPDTTTRNYLDKDTKLNSEYLERIVHHFKEVSLNWLVTGEGAPFLTSTRTMEASSKNEIKKIKGNVQANTGDTVNNITLDECQKNLTVTQTELEAARNEIKLLREQLALQAALVTAKDETINALKRTN